jgi:iron complex transport system ATP-binding protein
MISAERVSVDLGEREILHDLSFTVPEGRCVGLLGPNGSGKTTLLRTLAGLLPYRGALQFRGRPVRAWKPAELALHLAFVRQSTALTFDFKVEDLVLMGRAPHKGWLAPFTAHDRAMLQAALDRVDLAGFEQRPINGLSGGEQQRVLLAQALVQEAGLLLLDEPTAHLDVHHQYGFMTQVQDLVREGRTVIAAFHDLEIAARFADLLLVLQEGRLVAGGPPAEVLSRALVASVFRMDVQLDEGPGGHLQIHYLNPVPPTAETHGRPGR